MAARARPGRRLSRGIRAAVLGRPIAHSKSPALHSAAFAALGLDDSDYTRFDLGTGELAAFLDTHPDHTGFSLTMPLKERLVEIARERDWEIAPTAEATGVANTLVRDPAATLVANTDVDGIVRALAPVLAGAVPPRGVRDVFGLTATILGAGATARSALLACHRLGVTEVDVLVRNPARAQAVLDLAEALGIRAATAGLERVGPSSIVISTLPAEAAPALTWSREPAGSPVRAVALDVAYATDSGFLAAASAHGFIPVPGTAMLVEQALAQFGLFVAAAFGTPLTPAQFETVASAMRAKLAAAPAPGAPGN